MLQNESRALVGDNSGADEILVIRNIGGSKRKFSRIGDIVVATVKKVKKDFTSSSIKKGDVVRAVIVNSRKGFRRKDGTLIKFSKNYVVIVKATEKSTSGDRYEPVANRIFVPIVSEFSKRYKKLFSLAKDIV